MGVGMISSCNSARVQHLGGLHVAHLVVTPHGKSLPLRIANTSCETVELTKGCKLAEFCPLVESGMVTANNYSHYCFND